MPNQQALQDLARCAGTQCDLTVVDAFATVIARPRVNELDGVPRIDIPAPA